MMAKTSVKRLGELRRPLEKKGIIHGLASGLSSDEWASQATSPPTEGSCLVMQIGHTFHSLIYMHYSESL